MAITAENCARSTGSRARRRTSTRCAASSARPCLGRGPPRRGGRPRQIETRARDRRLRQGRSHEARDHARRTGQVARRHSQRTASSPPGTPAASSMGGRRSSCASRGGGERRGAHAACPARGLGDRRRRADADGHGAGARHPKAARADGLDAGPTSISSKSTRRSPRNTWRSRRNSGCDRDRVNVNGGAIALGHPLGHDRYPAAPDACPGASAARGLQGSRPRASAVGRGLRRSFRRPAEMHEG